MGNMCFPQEINSSSFVSMTLIILSAKQNFSMHNIKCDIGTQHVRTHTHTQTIIYIYLHPLPLTCFALLSGGTLIAPAAAPGAGSRMIMNISVSRANTHTLSLRRSPSPSLTLSLPSPLLSSPLLCSSSLCLKCNKTPPQKKKVSSDRFLFLNSEKCVKNSVPFTQWLQLSLCPGKHKRS